MLRVALALTVLLVLVTAPAASAAVLVHAPDPDRVCGDAIQVGVWENYGKPNPRGWGRKVTIKAIDDTTGRVWWSKTATATQAKWRYWYLPSGREGQCGPTTIVYYQNHGKVKSTFKVRFRPESEG